MTDTKTAPKKEPVPLKSLMTPSKTITFDYPGYEGFTVDLCFLAREGLLKLRKKCLSTRWDKKTRQPVEELDDDKFLVEYSAAVIKGWKGLKYSYLEELLLVDVSQFDPDDELPYTQDNAETLMQNGSDFDSWVTEMVGDLENFTRNK
tara:strand:- start:16548 stop:16991 length:444 start_codon:yes stop_codon:yes gene_type:complete